MNSSRTNTRIRIGGISQRWEQGYKSAAEFYALNRIEIRRVSQIDNMAVTRTALLEQLEFVIQQLDSQFSFFRVALLAMR